MASAAFTRRGGGRASPRLALLLRWYEAMAAHFGPCRWWPGETFFEVAVGAVLTQNTAWRNVDKALDRLRERDALRPEAIAAMPDAELEECLRPSGFFRLKARRLRNLLDLFARYPGWDKGPENTGLGFLQQIDTGELRDALLGVRGVGPETADCILLYALGRPSFVVDAYTRRLCHRHGQLPEDVPYDELRDFFMDVLPEDVPLYNEYHALIVRTGNSYCKKSKPLCHLCPLGAFLE